MFEGLQKKWKLSAGKVILILIIFALGGSLTGYVARKLMPVLSIDSTAVSVIVYILLVTILWPAAVLLVSMPFGQFSFFSKYIARMGKRLTGGNSHRREAKGEGQRSDIGNQKPEIRNQKSPKGLTIFASGAGSNARQIINYFRDAGLAKVVLIVCNKPGAGVIAIAEQEGIPLLLIGKERFTKDGYLSELRAAGTDLIVLAGFLWKIPQTLIDAYPRRIVNIHPALLPRYGGRGMYGQYVHESVLNAGEMESGITIHYVDEHYDNGDIIFQTACPVLEGDTAASLAQRIHQLEHLHYPRVVEEILQAL